MTAHRGATLRAALIDLDGTLLDTAPDLAAAVWSMLSELRLRPLAESEIRDFIGQGVARLVRRCIEAAGAPSDAEVFEAGLSAFSRAYEDESGRRTRFYPGVIEGLDELSSQGIALACVTNKIGRFTAPLLQRTGLAERFDVVVTGDSVPQLKPHPEPLLLACRRLRVGPGEAVVIGDSRNDVVAARAAGCRVLCVPYGYTEGQPVSALGCDAVVADLREAARYVRNANREANETAAR